MLPAAFAMFALLLDNTAAARKDTLGNVRCLTPSRCWTRYMEVMLRSSAEVLCLDQDLNLAETTAAGRCQVVSTVHPRDGESGTGYCASGVAPTPCLSSSSAGHSAFVSGSASLVSNKARPLVRQVTMQQLLQDQMPTYVNDNGCLHYKRSCLVICNKCNRTYPCHICHNNIEGHHLSRSEITKILCLQCGSIQGKAAACVKCKHSLSDYFCEVCCIWSCGVDIFHCQKCGLCRLGSPELFEHCDRCEACIEKTSACHNHVSGGMKNNCPICAESMFDSCKQVILLRCGHSLHEECYVESIKSSIHCPLCFKLVGDDREIRSQIKAMVDENVYEVSVVDSAESYISCFECGNICTTAKPSLFNACSSCGSYNTKIKNDT